jgi:hypothetical protein
MTSRGLVEERWTNLSIQPMVISIWITEFGHAKLIVLPAMNFSETNSGETSFRQR